MSAVVKEKGASAARQRGEGVRQQRGAGAHEKILPRATSPDNGNAQSAPLRLTIHIEVAGESTDAAEQKLAGVLERVLAAQAPQRRWLDSDGIAAHLGCSRAKIDRHVRDDAMPHYYLGDQRRFDPQAVDTWLVAGGGAR